MTNRTNKTNKTESDFEIVDSKMSIYHNCLSITWSTKGAGFGETVLYYQQTKREDGMPTGEFELCCDNEAMSREFILSVFEHVLRKVKLVDEQH